MAHCFHFRNNTLHKVHVIDELIQLSVGLDADVITNSFWIVNLMQGFSLEYIRGLIASMLLSLIKILYILYNATGT